jgi:hypothetical protein
MFVLSINGPTAAGTGTVIALPPTGDPMWSATASTIIFASSHPSALDCFLDGWEDEVEQARFRARYRAIPARYELRAAGVRLKRPARRRAPPPRDAPWPTMIRSFS